MKALARGFVWWPKIDSQIENCVRNCTPCQGTPVATSLIATSTMGMATSTVGSGPHGSRWAVHGPHVLDTHRRSLQMD